MRGIFAFEKLLNLESPNLGSRNTFPPFITEFSSKKLLGISAQAQLLPGWSFFTYNMHWLEVLARVEL
jgi:hypothetical protein